MAIKTISMKQTFNAPVSKVFADLSDHENFGRICGIKMTRVKDGSDCENGLGSIRKINIGLLPSFDETITDFEAEKLIEYKITRGSPIKNHVGKLLFSEEDGKTSLDYTIRLESKIPGTSGLISSVLEAGITKGLKKYANGL